MAKIRVIVAKAGLDGHYRGAKVVARMRIQQEPQQRRTRTPVTQHKHRISERFGYGHQPAIRHHRGLQHGTTSPSPMITLLPNPRAERSARLGSRSTRSPLLLGTGAATSLLKESPGAHNQQRPAITINGDTSRPAWPTQPSCPGAACLAGARC